MTDQEKPTIAEQGGGIMQAFVYGKYRNHVGAEIEITGTVHQYFGVQIIGTVYRARQVDALFPGELLITPEGLIDCGYERVEE